MIEELLRTITAYAVAMVEYFSWYGVFIAMVMESACLPIPSEVVMPLAGFVLCHDAHDVLKATLLASIANLIGSWIAYAMGLYGGRPLIRRYGRYLLIREKEIRMAENFFAKHGEIAVLVARVMPAIRTVIGFPAGLFKMDLAKFSIYTLIGSIPWNFMLTYLGFILKERWYIVEEYVHALIPPLLLATALLVVSYIVLRRLRLRQLRLR